MVQICSSGKVALARGPSGSSGAVGRPHCPAQRSLPEPEGAGVRDGSLGEKPRAPSLGPGPLENLQ